MSTTSYRAMSTSTSRSSLFEDDDSEDLSKFGSSSLEKLGIGKGEINQTDRIEKDGFPVPATVANRPRSQQFNTAKDSEKVKVQFTVVAEDPLAVSSSPPRKEPVKYKNESLTIRMEDEQRIVAAMTNAANKQTTGSVFSVKVDIGVSGTLGIGVKDLSGNLLAVSMLKRSNGELGAGEAAGLRLGDIIFGINFTPAREGSRTLLKVLKKENQRRRKSVYLQCWRCHQLCSDNIPGALFPKANDVIVQAHFLFRTKVFSDWERWTFIEILSRYFNT